MKAYLQFQVLNPDGKTVVFDRVLPDCSLFGFNFNEVISSLHLLFPNGIVLITSKSPKSV